MTTGRTAVTVLRGATVFDGTGEPGRRADVAFAGGRIVETGTEVAGDVEEVDLSGLVLAPGFVDPHTHYDAQILWDPALSPSSWYGVTTVVTGNCGFTVAPTRPDHRDVIVRTLEQVEGMSADALRSGIDWSFETFPDYLDAVRRRPKRVNVACMLGHTALRWYVVGDEAADRTATAAEVDRMCELVRQASLAGAVGLSTSRHNHVGAFGKPVPSRLADTGELVALADALGDTGRGAMQLALGEDFGIQEVVRLAERTGRPATWSASVLVPSHGEGGLGPAIDAVESSSSSGAPVLPQFPCRPIVNQICLRDPFPLRAASEGFLEVLRARPETRIAMFRDESWRRRTRDAIRPVWARRLAEATVQESNVHADLVGGITLGSLAERDGTTPLDLLLDLSLAEDLDTRFCVAVANTDEEVITRLLGDPRCLLGLSDAGAHVSQLCDADYATYLLGHWVRAGTLPLETAVWRLTGQPAAFFGLLDRGRIAPGWAADLVAFDPATVGSGPVTRRWDFPGGTDRLIAESRGIEFVWVNGTLVRSEGSDLEESAPGRLLTPAASG